MRPEDTAAAGGSVGNAVEEDMNSDIDRNYSSWRELWDLDDMTPREIYEAGFRHGYDASEARK